MPAEIEPEIWKLVFQAVSALAAVAGITWTVIWAIRGPRLRISLLDSSGYRTTWGDSHDAPPAFIYHIRVKNKRKWVAKNVRIKVTRINKEGGSQGNGEQRAPVCLIWAAHPSPKLYLMDVLGLDEEACNLGYIAKNEQMFKLDAMDPARNEQNYKWPPHFQGFLNGGETMQVELVAIAENARSNALHLKVSWDGQWCDTSDEMEKHLVVNTIRP
ncbi:MAG: hypothetical protein L0Z73_15350 [Gammaproteobacteria bacterium]|nr:hypothetical protein [Gammaproteobacteria bacterium]